jgi:hypothetical protein
MSNVTAGDSRGSRLATELVYFNGIDFETGEYAVNPLPIGDLAHSVIKSTLPPSPDHEFIEGLSRAFAAPFGMDMTCLADVGWGIVFAENAPDEVRRALDPLVELRRKQAGGLLKILDCKAGEQVRDWYLRHEIAPSNLNPNKVPYYLLLVGNPTEIPFDFQYLIGVEYAVGRLGFDTPAEYHQYAATLVAYETGSAVNNSKQIAYWGTQHIGDPATSLSSRFLIDPLANGIDDPVSQFRIPVHQRKGVDCSRTLMKGDNASRGALLETLHTSRPPAVLFTASHGISVPNGRPNQIADNGALLCQDWPGFGSMKREYMLSAADLADDANVAGLVAFLFACYGGGTPDIDEFPRDMAEVGKLPAPAPKPFLASLPRRLLAHPGGSALAVIAHVDRAWGYSIEPVKLPEPQIAMFYNSLCLILSGCKIGHAISQQFGQHYAFLCAALLAATAPMAASGARIPDREIVQYWLERNDAKNYVVLGDPAAQVRNELLIPASK